VSSSDQTSNIWRLRAVGAAAGLILAVCSLYPAVVPLQIVAFAMLFYLPAKGRLPLSSLLLTGLYLGLGYTVPQVLALRLPAIMTLILILDLVAMSMVLCWLTGRLLSGPAVLSAFAVASCVTILDWLNYTLIPLWGTAQSFARSWSEYPRLIQFESFTGMPGTVFIVILLAALVVRLGVDASSSTNRTSVRVAIIVVLCCVLMAGIFADSQKPEATIRAAAIGWPLTRDSIAPDSPAGFDSLIAEPIAAAARQGARVVVAPEAALGASRETRKQLFATLSGLAITNNVCIVVGYIDMEADENRLVVITSDGQVGQLYAKTHTIFIMEQWNKGTGDIALTDIAGVKLAGMICQDDNFTDISRKASRLGAGVVAIPTLDWACVSSANVHNSLHRPIESGYAIIRAATNGVSLIADAHGTVLAEMDHNKAGAGYIVADLPVYGGGTFYGTAGNWLLGLCLVILAACVVRQRRDGHCPADSLR
jgi:apolipoprotein N-acyltransferase